VDKMAEPLPAFPIFLATSRPDGESGSTDLQTTFPVWTSKKTSSEGAHVALRWRDYPQHFNTLTKVGSEDESEFTKTISALSDHSAPKLNVDEDESEFSKTVNALSEIPIMSLH